jgi:hypothetical protein
MIELAQPMRARFLVSLRALAAVLVFWGLLVGAGPVPAAPAAPPTSGPASETTPEGIGLQAASVLTSILYLPCKSILALAGGLAGGIAYAFSAGDLEVAEAVWGPSVYGTYLLTPDHLTGRKPVQFFGAKPSQTSSR